MYVCIKAKTIKSYFNLFRVHSLKIDKKTIRKKNKQSKRGSSEMLMLLLSGVKDLKKFNLVN